jgi:hypothetical protein
VVQLSDKHEPQINVQIRNNVDLRHCRETKVVR